MGSHPAAACDASLRKDKHMSFLYSYFSVKTFAVVTHWKCLFETLPMSNHNKYFNYEIKKKMSLFFAIEKWFHPWHSETSDNSNVNNLKK